MTLRFEPSRLFLKLKGKMDDTQTWTQDLLNTRGNKMKSIELQTAYQHKGPVVPGSDFFFCKGGLHFSQSYGAYFNMT